MIIVLLYYIVAYKYLYIKYVKKISMSLIIIYLSYKHVFIALCICTVYLYNYSIKYDIIKSIYFVADMPPTKKTDLDKLAWAWIESISPEQIEKIHLETAYRIGLKNCKNCK